MEFIRSFNHDFDAIVTVYSDRIALVKFGEEEYSLTYRQLDILADRNIAWMRTLDINPGDRVGVALPNSLELLVLFVACLRGGVDFAPLACDTANDEIQRWAHLIKPRCCFFSPLLADQVISTLETTNRLCVPVMVDGRFGHLPKDAGVQQHSSNACLYLFSSGTTGIPKAIVINGDRLWSSGYAFVRLHGAGFDKPFRIWNYLPQSYLGGLFNLALIPFSVAGTVVVDEIFSGKTFLSFWQTLERYEINTLWLVPTIVRGLIAIGSRTQRARILPCTQVVDLAFLGTAPIERDTKAQFEKLFGISLLENYGLSETTFITSEFSSEADMRNDGSVGRCLPYVELRFRSVSGEDAAYSEILVHTPYSMDGYLDENGNLMFPDQDGFFPTGDLGYLDATGKLVLTGRIKDIIKKGGYFIGLREIELLAQRHPQVEEAAAVSIPHQFYGESYRLKVRMKSAANKEEEEDIRNFMFSSLAKHKWPESVDVVDNFPLTASGKVRKFILGQKK